MVSFQCLICNHISSNKGNLKIHEDNIHKNIKFDCQDCGKQFTRRFSLTQHIDNVHKGIKQKCDICDKEFSTVGTKNNHVRSVHELMNTVHMELSIKPWNLTLSIWAPPSLNNQLRHGIKQLNKKQTEILSVPATSTHRLSFCKKYVNLVKLVFCSKLY